MTKTDLIGKKFNKLTVIEYVGRNIHKKNLWKCLCECGSYTIKTIDKLNSGIAKSCGCIKSPNDEIYKSLQMKKLIKNSRLNEKTGCIEWIAYKSPEGYGKTNIRKKVVLAHRLSWILSIGEIPENMMVLHKCDNPSCINVNHLFLGTQKDNIYDMLNKHREFDIKKIKHFGSDHKMSKLKENEVQYIRIAKSLGIYSQNALAKRFNVSKHAIYCLLKGKTWRHLPLPKQKENFISQQEWSAYINDLFNEGEMIGELLNFNTV